MHIVVISKWQLIIKIGSRLETLKIQLEIAVLRKVNSFMTATPPPNKT